MHLKTPFCTILGAAFLLSVNTSRGIEREEPPPVAPPPIVVYTPPPEEKKPADETDLDALASALFSGLPLTAVQQQFLASLSQTVLQDVNNRLFRLRAGVNLPANGAQGPSGKEAKAPPEEIFHRWEIFGAGDYGQFDLDDNGRQAGFQSDTWVATIGAEYHVNRFLSFGVAGSYVNSRSDLSRRIGSVDLEGVALSAYGSAVWDHFYFDLLYSYAAYDDTIRRSTFGTGTAHGDTEARTNALQFNTGYVFKTDALRTGPIAALNWIHGEIEGYNETGGGSGALNNPGQDFDSLVSQVGWQVSYAMPTGFGSVIPQIRATWDHEYLNSTQNISATLEQSPFSGGGSFTATGKTAQAGRDFLNLGAGISAQFGERVTVTADYQTHLFQERATAHTASLKVGISF